MRKIISKAAADLKAHFKRCTPITEDQGLKEANIAFLVSHAFRNAGYLIYPEFRFRGGSIDAVFVKKDEAIICEWKQLHQRTIASITSQTKRMRAFARGRNLANRGFKGEIRKIRFLWICDTWEPDLREWWFDRECVELAICPFRGWTLGEEAFDSFGEDWSPYHWLWAYSERKTEPNQALQTTTTAVTDRAPSSTLRASGGRV